MMFLIFLYLNNMVPKYTLCKWQCLVTVSKVGHIWQSFPWNKMSMCVWHDWLLGTWGSILGTDPGFKNMSVPQGKPKGHGDEKTGLACALPIPCSLTTVKSLKEVLKEQESVSWKLLEVAPTSCGIILFFTLWLCITLIGLMKSWLANSEAKRF